MKKKFAILPYATFVAIGFFSGCNEHLFNKTDAVKERSNWSITTQCNFSTDGGTNYSPNIKEFFVGETTYMKLLINAETDSFLSKTKKPIGVILKIPNVRELSANYDDGPNISPIYDEINKIAIYRFNVMGAKDSMQTSLVFQFKPNAICDATITVEYDDQINSAYDVRRTVHFIALEKE